MSKPYNHSWVTQRMANRLPLWADARLLRSSWLQQFLNTIGVVYEDLYKQLAIESKNYYATTANLDEIDVVYKVQLPYNYNFSVNDHDPANPVTIPPEVTTVINGTPTVIPVAENNDILSFWYNILPTRINLQGDTTDVSLEVLAPTSFSNLATASFNTFPLEGRLSLTIADANEFINTKRIIQRGFVRLKGVTRKGQEDTETISFLTNTTLLTIKEWRRLTSVSVHGIFPTSATLAIKVLPFNVGEYMDLLNLYVDEVNEMVLFTSVVQEGYSALLQYKVLAATNLGMLQQGFNVFDIREQAELLDTNGDSIVSRDFALQPFQDKVYVLGSDRIYVYYNYMPYPNYKALGKETEDALMLAATERVSYIKGQTVKIYSDRPFPTKRVVKNRWTLTKPDGNRVRLGLDATEWPMTQSGWILNSYTDTRHFTKQQIKYTPTQTGTYTVELEVFYHDGEIQNDKHAFNINILRADKELPLPVTVQNADGLAFDSDQNLWIKKGNTAYKMKLLTDVMLVDFEKHIIYFHEQYDKVTIQTGA